MVDNASQDGTPQRVAAEYPAAQLLANRENLGFGRACNQGARGEPAEVEQRIGAHLRRLRRSRRSRRSMMSGALTARR